MFYSATRLGKNCVKEKEKCAQLLSRVLPFAAPWTVAHQARNRAEGPPLAFKCYFLEVAMELSRQEY